MKPVKSKNIPPLSRRARKALENSFVNYMGASRVKAKDVTKEITNVILNVYRKRGSYKNPRRRSCFELSFYKGEDAIVYYLSLYCGCDKKPEKGVVSLDDAPASIKQALIGGRCG